MEDVISRPARERLGDTKRRCLATSKTTGERCGRAPIPGGFVCVNHGGAAPHVQRSADERLRDLVDPAISALTRMLRSLPECRHCGRTDADRDPVVLSAAKTILDRCGFGPGMSVDLKTSGSVTHAAAWIPSERLAQIGAWLEEAKQAMAAGLPPVRVTALLPPAPDGATTIDGEVVDEDADQGRDARVGRRGRRRAFQGIPEPPRPAGDREPEG